MDRAMIPKKGSDETNRKFAKVRGRQLLGVTVAIWSVVILAVLSRRPDLFGYIDKVRASFLQVLVILAFVCFSAWNWRCPSCNRYLGAGLTKERGCRKCGVKLRA
jgi:SNF family Na+-dependent transporter